MNLITANTQIPAHLTGPLLEGRVVFITGAGSPHGLGRAMAILMAAHGARVAVTDRDGEGARRVAAELGATHIGLACDITDPRQCADALAAAEEALGPTDVLVNNAGYGIRRSTLDVTLDDFADMMRVNAQGTFLMTKAVLPGMVERGKGNIIYISTAAAQRPGGTHGASHYAASKSAMTTFTIALAREFGGRGIRSNIVAPNMIDNDAANQMNREQRKEWEKLVPMARSGTPWDVAGAVLFMASDLSSYCNGATLDVNGGFNTR